MSRARRAAARLASVLALAGCVGSSWSCGGGGGERPADAAPGDAEGTSSAAGASAIRFRDATEGSGLDRFRQENGHRDKPFILESIGAGLALFDADGDGDLDCYLTSGSSLEGFADGEEPRDALFANDGTARFTDVTAERGLGDTGWTCGARTGDVDGDGRVDLYLTSFGPNVLYRNAGATFEDVTAASGADEPRWSTGACFLDHDADGDLDLYVANYLVFNRDAIERFTPTQEYQGVEVYFGPQGLRGQSDAFLVNRGDGTFEDASAAAGIAGPELHGFDAVAFDEDGDGWCDVYVANDSHPNLMWRNRGDGTFADVADQLGLARSRDGVPQAGMGVAVGDADADGAWDLLVSNFSGDYDTLYARRSGGFYDDASHRARLATPTFMALGWGCTFTDFDLDGDRDAFVANGHVYPQVDLFDLGTRYRQRNQAFDNDGTGRFTEVRGPGRSRGRAVQPGPRRRRPGRRRRRGPRGQQPGRRPDAPDQRVRAPRRMDLAPAARRRGHEPRRDRGDGGGASGGGRGAAGRRDRERRLVPLERRSAPALRARGRGRRRRAGDVAGGAGGRARGPRGGPALGARSGTSAGRGVTCRG